MPVRCACLVQMRNADGRFLVTWTDHHGIHLRAPRGRVMGSLLAG
jgi:hypothetical protein